MSVLDKINSWLIGKPASVLAKRDPHLMLKIVVAGAPMIKHRFNHNDPHSDHDTEVESLKLTAKALLENYAAEALKPDGLLRIADFVVPTRHVHYFECTLVNS